MNKFFLQRFLTLVSLICVTFSFLLIYGEYLRNRGMNKNVITEMQDNLKPKLLKMFFFSAKCMILTIVFRSGKKKYNIGHCINQIYVIVITELRALIGISVYILLKRQKQCG